MSYATKDRERDEITLNTPALRDPAVFIAALRDYVRTCAMPLWEQSETLNVSTSEWTDHLRSCEEVLLCGKKKYGHALSWSNVYKRIIGQSAELVVSRWMESFIQTFPKDSETDLHIPRWDTKGESLPMGSGYSLETIPPTNIFLVKAEGTHKMYLEELDMMMLIGNDTAYLLDVTTSVEKGKYSEIDFLLFRKRLKELFVESNGEAGFKELAKIHVLCNEIGANDTTAIHTNNGSVFKLTLPIYDTIRCTAERTIASMQHTDILQRKSRDNFTFGKNSRLNQK